VPRSRRGVFGASRPPSPETTACTMEAVRPLAQAVTCMHYASLMLNPIFNITFIVCLVQSMIHIDAKVLVNLTKHRQADPTMEESPISTVQNGFFQPLNL